MDDVLILKLLTSAHLLLAALFVGGNVFLDFIMAPRLDLIPPGQAARMGEKMGNDIAIFNWICLVGLVIFGGLLAWRLGISNQMFTGTFLTSGYGAALLVKELLWTSLVASGAIMTFYLRPRVIVKLPYDASRERIETDRDATIANAAWMQRLARYNAIAGMIALVAGAFLSRGGLWT